MTPYERLMAEAIPTRPPPAPTPPRPIRPWTPAEQTRHLAELLQGIDGWVWDEEQRDNQRRHLRLIQQPDAA